MGSTKNANMEHEDNLAIASEYLVRKGKLKRCPVHEEIHGGGPKLEQEFWPFAMADRNLGDSGPVPWAAAFEAREFTDLLTEAYDHHSAEGCGYCAKNMKD